jgi:hypothetical protein
MPTTLTLQPTGQQLTVPTRWADVTLAQFVERYAGPTERSPVEIFCDLPAGGLDELAVEDVHYLANLLEFTTDPSDVLALPATPALPDVGSLPYGTYVVAKQVLTADPEAPMLSHGPYLLALYRTQLTWGKYDKAKVAACQAALLAAPVTESYGDIAFFLSSIRRLVSGTLPTKPTKPTPKKKSSKPAWKSLANASGRFSTWMRRLAAPS